MPPINFFKVPDMVPRFEWPYKVIPDDEYLVQLIKAESEFESTGCEVWQLLWGIIAGPEKGVGVKDWLRWGDSNPKFNDTALSRCKMACKCAGIDVAKDAVLNVKTDNLVGMYAWIKTYQNQPKGGTKIYTNVSMDGIRPATAEDLARAEVGAPVVSADIPF